MGPYSSRTGVGDEGGGDTVGEEEQKPEEISETSFAPTCSEERHLRSQMCGEKSHEHSAAVGQ